MGRERGRSRGVGVRSADVGQARVLAPFALTRIQVVWISVWVSLSVCCRTFQILRSGQDVCARIQKAETIEPAIIRSIPRKSLRHVSREKYVRRDSYSYNCRMNKESPAIFDLSSKIALSLSCIRVSRINFRGSSKSRCRITEDYWKAANLYRAGINSRRLTQITILYNQTKF